MDTMATTSGFRLGFDVFGPQMDLTKFVKYCNHKRYKTECNLAKVDVAGSNPVSRSNLNP